MPSWVRYSVTMYLGLLLAGSIVVPRPNAEAEVDGRYLMAEDLIVPMPAPTLREIIATHEAARAARDAERSESHSRDDSH